MTMMKILLPSSKNVSRPDIENVEQDAEWEFPTSVIKMRKKLKERRRWQGTSLFTSALT